MTILKVIGKIGFYFLSCNIHCAADLVLGSTGPSGFRRSSACPGTRVASTRCQGRSCHCGGACWVSRGGGAVRKAQECCGGAPGRARGGGRCTRPFGTGEGGQELMRLGMRFARPEGKEPALERMLKASTPSPLY